MSESSKSNIEDIKIEDYYSNTAELKEGERQGKFVVKKLKYKYTEVCNTILLNFAVDCLKRGHPSRIGVLQENRPGSEFAIEFDKYWFKDKTHIKRLFQDAVEKYLRDKNFENVKFIRELGIESLTIKTNGVEEREEYIAVKVTIEP